MISDIDTGALHAILRNERRRAAMEQLETASFIDVHTVGRFQGDIFADGVADRDDAEALFSVDRRNVPCCAEWRDFYVEAVIGHVTARGVGGRALSSEAGAWLLRQADRTRTVHAFAILLGVLDRCRALPPFFVREVASRAEHGWPGLAAMPAARAA